MPNERLRFAMASAHVDVAKLAAAAQVDPKTVQRWLAGRVPHARHRWVVADLLHEREEMLWPSESPGIAPGTTKAAEIVGVYTRRAEVPRPLWTELLGKARRRLDLLGYAMLFLPEQHPDLIGLLKSKVTGPCQVRIALADPGCEQVAMRDAEEHLGGTMAARIRTTLALLDELVDWPGIDIRFHSAPLYNSIFRFDNDMLVTPHLYATHGFNAPVLHLRRLETDGLFESFTVHFENLWASTTPLPLRV